MELLTKISRLILAITGAIALYFASFPTWPATAVPIFPTVQLSKLIALQTSTTPKQLLIPLPPASLQQQ